MRCTTSHFGSRLDKQADEFGYLVGGYSAGDTYKNMLPFQNWRHNKLYAELSELLTFTRSILDNEFVIKELFGSQESGFGEGFIGA